MKVSIVGVGQTKFGKRQDASSREIVFEAFQEAIDDARISSKEIDASIICSATHYEKQRSPAGVIAEYLGLNPQATFNLEAICASSSVGVRVAWSMIKSGLHNVVAVVGFQKMSELRSSEIQEVMGLSGDAMWESPFGTSMPAYYALYAKAYMEKYGATEEHMAKVSVKNRHYGAKNPKAMFQKEITMQQVLDSKIVSNPLKILDCCANSDGASVLILTNEDRAKKMNDTPVWIEGLGLGSSSMSISGRQLPLTSFTCSVEASKQAYRMARLEPSDIDVVELHDSFSIAEIIGYEDLGLCQRGEGIKLIDENQTYVGGKFAANIDGGLISKGHPVAATGGSQLRTLVLQLRGESREAQVENAKFALSHNVGGIGMYGAVTILGV